MSDVELQDCLSFKEKTFASKLHQLNKSYFEQVLYNRLESVVREDFERADDMLKHCTPKLNEFVFCRFLWDCGDVVIGQEESGEDTMQSYEAGDIVILRYISVQELVKIG